MLKRVTGYQFFTFSKVSNRPIAFDLFCTGKVSMLAKPVPVPSPQTKIGTCLRALTVEIIA